MTFSLPADGLGLGAASSPYPNEIIFLLVALGGHARRRLISRYDPAAQGQFFQRFFARGSTELAIGLPLRINLIVRFVPFGYIELESDLRSASPIIWFI